MHEFFRQAFFFLFDRERSSSGNLFQMNARKYTSNFSFGNVFNATHQIAIA